MINRAFDEEKIVVLCTGRCVPELEEYFALIPRLRYAVCNSGAMVYDAHQKKVLSSDCISVENVRKILEACRLEQPMVHFLARDSIVEVKCVGNMQKYGMGVYQPMFLDVTKKVEDIYNWYEENSFPLEKFNIYHTSLESRARTRERIKNLPLALADAENFSLECTAAGITKGTGLEKLCNHLGLGIKECIAVGDADNDLPMLQIAGLPLAMGNANKNVRAITKIMLPNNDHDGCAEAIEKFLLKE